MATELGQAYIQLMPSAKGIGKNIEKELNNETGGAGDAAGKKMGGSLVSTLGKVLVAAGIGKIITSAINAGGELQQNLGGTEAVFGDFAKSIQGTAKDAYKNMGLSASDYMATANKMGSLFQGSGVKQERALEMTSTAMQRAADVASVMGLDTTMAMESIAGAAKGNFTMMDNLGVAMNATSLQAYALEKGVNFDWKTASNAEKAELAMQMFMDRTTQYAGNFAKESEETFSGSLGAMKSSFMDMLGALSTGEGLPAALENLAGTVVTFAKNLIPMVSNVLTELPDIIVTLISETGPELLQAGMTAIGEIATGIGEALPELIPKALEAIMALINTFSENIPMLLESGMNLIIGLAQGVMDAIPVLLEKAPEIIRNLITSLMDRIPYLVQTGVDLLTSLIDDMPTIITTILDVLPGLIEDIITALLDNLPYIVESGIELFTALIDAMPQILVTIAKSMPRIIDSITKTLLSKIDVIIKAGVDLLTALITAMPQIIGEIGAAMPEIISSMVTALGNGLKDFKEIGKQLLLGLGEGISGAVGAVVKKATEAAQKIVDSVKNFFGIRSPSRVFMQIGAYLDEGLAEGISDNVKPITKAMDEVGALTTKSFESDLAFNASTAGMNSLNASLNSGLRTEQANAQSRLEDLMALSVSVLQKYLPQLANMQMVLDTGEIAGRLQEEMDFITQKELGGVGVV